MLSSLRETLAGPQSALAPAGPHAQGVADLAWIMFAGGAAILLLVIGLAGLAVAAPPAARAWLARPAVVVLGGIVFPVVVLTALLVGGLSLTRALTAGAGSNSLTIAVSGERFWWRVRYAEDGAAPAFTTANEIHVPTGRMVRLVLTSPDVIHSFWIPALAGKLDMIPGQENTLVFKAERTGVYRGQCAEFCGGGHTWMAFDVVVHTPDEFSAWRAAQAAPAQTVEAPAPGGQAIFLSSGCGGCHSVRGTPAQGEIGPDLTHVGSRRTIAAGLLPTSKAAFAAWIVDAHRLKPQVAMPSYPFLEGESLNDLASYLEGLK